jgi:hypothetical protein
MGVASLDICYVWYLLFVCRIYTHAIIAIQSLDTESRPDYPSTFFVKRDKTRLKPRQHGRIFIHSHAAVNPGHIQHKDALPAPTSKVYDPSIMAAFSALAAHQHRPCVASRGAFRFPHTWGTTGRELI